LKTLTEMTCVISGQQV